MEGEGVEGEGVEGEDAEADAEAVGDDVVGEGVKSGSIGADVFDNTGKMDGNTVGEVTREGECVDTESGSIHDIPADIFTEGKNNSLVGDTVEEGVNTSDP